MGRDKALLPLGHESFLQHLILMLRDAVSPLVIVLGHHAPEIERQIGLGSREQGSANREERTGNAERQAALVLLRNPDYSLGQLSSLQVALRYLERLPVSAALVALVDHPAITRGVVERLLERFEARHPLILIPTFQGRRGHPVLFARSLFQELLEAPLDQGARFVVQRHAAEVDLMETEEEGILLDIDDPADYERLLKRIGTKKQGAGNREQGAENSESNR